MIIKKYKEIRKRGHFTIIDDGSVQKELSRMLLKNCVQAKVHAEEKKEC